MNVLSDDLNDELSPVKLKEGFIRREAGEIMLEVRPQYCKFDEKELASTLLKHVGLDLLCLPWVEITEQSYEKFKVKGGGSLPKQFYTVESSRKMN